MVHGCLAATEAAMQHEIEEVLERITDGFYALDRDYRFTHINPMAEKILGRPRHELLGKTFRDEFGDVAEPPLYAVCQQAMTDGTTTKVEFYYFPLGAWFEARIYPSAAGLSIFLRDMTAGKDLERRLRASEIKYRTLMEQIPAVVYVLAADENQTPLYFSPRIQELTGELPDEAIALKEHWLQLVHPEDYARVAEENERTTVSGEPFRMEYRHRRKNGSYVWVRDECLPIHDASGELVGWQGVLLDVSARVQLEAAQEANRVKSALLGMMSHELRTPMQSVLGYAALLLSGHRGTLTPEQVEDISYIKLGADRMMTLIEQMLDLSQLEAEQLELAVEPVDLNETIEALRQDVALQAATKSLELRIELPPSLPAAQGDPGRVRQILRNLIDNALKFTEAGSIRIAARTTEGGVAVAVSDTGIGIAAETLPHIFEEFRQADSSLTRHHGGAGLGLAIAHELAKRMGGSITVVSQHGAGSTFTLHLPTAFTGTTSRRS